MVQIISLLIIYSPKINAVFANQEEKIKKWLAITPWATEEEFEMKLAEALNNQDFKVKMFGFYGN